MIFVAFTGEEFGRICSRYFVKNYSELKKCIAMINLDTVGRLNNKKLLIIGFHSAKEWPLILKEASLIFTLEYETVRKDIDSSDQKSFEEIGVPAIQLSSGLHEDYHKIIDTIEKIDMDGLKKIALIERLDKRIELSFTGNVNKGDIIDR